MDTRCIGDPSREHQQHEATSQGFRGQPAGPQIAALEKGLHVAVGTPGRVLDLLTRGKLFVRQVRCVRNPVRFMDQQPDVLVTDRDVERGHQRIVDGVFRSIARLLLVFSRFPRLNRDNVGEWIRLDGFEYEIRTYLHVAL